MAYIASSAKEMNIDPNVYAPLRLLSVMLRLLDLHNDGNELDQAFIGELKQMIFQNRSLLLNDKDKFGQFLNELVTKIAVNNFRRIE